MLSGKYRIFDNCGHVTEVRFAVPSVWLRPNNQRREADAAKALLTVPDGDHLTLMNVFNQYIQCA